MSKPQGDPSCGTSSEDVLIPTERHPAYRQREARSGSGTERENLAGDAKAGGMAFNSANEKFAAISICPIVFWTKPAIWPDSKWK
jgi:hypothetical protein